MPINTDPNPSIDPSPTTVEPDAVRTAGKSALTFIFFTVLLDLMGMTILIPVQAYIVRAYSTDALTVTLLTVIYAAAQFLAAPLLGQLSDRYGRRPVLLSCILGSAIGYFIFGIGGALWVLFLSRLIDGITGGNISVASAYVADVTPPEERAKNFGMIGAAFGLGFILGPLLGGALGQISLAAPAYAAGVLSLLSFTFGYFVLAESLPVDRRTQEPLTWRAVNPLASLFDMLRRSPLGQLLLVQCVFNFTFGGVNTVYPIFLIDRFGAQPWQIAGMFLAVGVANVAVQAGLIGRLAPRFGEKRLALVGFAIQAGCLLLALAAPVFGAFYLIGAISSVGAGLIFPTLGALVANSVSPQEQGKVAGVSAALGSLMSVFGPLWSGAVYDNVAPGAPYWMGAIIFAGGILLLMQVRPMVVQAATPSATL